MHSIPKLTIQFALTTPHLMFNLSKIFLYQILLSSAQRSLAKENIKISNKLSEQSSVEKALNITRQCSFEKRAIFSFSFCTTVNRMHQRLCGLTKKVCFDMFSTGLLLIHTTFAAHPLLQISTN